MLRSAFITLAFAAFSITTALGQEAPPAAKQVLKEAVMKASAENKHVFIMFHASWCGWCHRMDSLMNKPELKKYFDDNYVIRHLVVLESEKKKNLENPGALDMLKKFHGDKQGIPFWLIFDKLGNLQADCLMRPEGAGLDKPGENTGCPASPPEVAHFIKVLSKTSKLTKKELEIIAAQFTRK